MANELERKTYTVAKPVARLVLAHGAGAGNQHEFMESMSQALCELGIEVVSFNFDYMVRQYQEQKKRPPDRQDKLLARFNQELDRIGEDEVPLFVAGKSMGGRMATLLQERDLIKGVIVYGYPFIPPGKPEKLTQRIAHFEDNKTPMLICQGERDTFGNKALIESITLPKSIELQWVNSGDHSYKPLKSSGIESRDNIVFAAKATKAFVESLV